MADHDEGSECGICKGEVKEGDRGVQCDCCGTWVHDKCGDINANVYNTLKKFSGAKLGTGLHWYCPSCNKGMKDWILEMRGMKERQGKVEKDLEGLKKVVEEIRNEIKEAKVESGEERTKLWSELVARQTVEKREVVVGGAMSGGEVITRNVSASREIQGTVTEAMEREKRKSNLVIMGIKETTGDEYKEEVENLVKDLMEGEYVKIQVGERIGRKEGKVRPIRIVVEDVVHRRKILSKAKELKNMVGKERTYIVPDLTRKQQEDDRKLRDQVKIFKGRGDVGVKIVKGQVVKGDGRDREVLFRLDD
jgi:hypothetical protein